MTLRKEDISLIEQLTHQSDRGDYESDARAYRKILSTSTNWETSSKDNVEFSEFVEKFDLDKDEQVKPVDRVKWMIAASVTLIMVIGSWLFYLSDQVSYQTPLAQMKTVWLPDSSKVILNADAQLSYSRKAWKKHVRKVQLAGIAYFEVRKGSRFVVETAHGEIAVLGTSFNVKALKDDFVVECITGKVAVSNDIPSEAVVLTPGLRVESTEVQSVLVAETFDPVRGKEWVTGTFNFDKQPIEDVFFELERQYDVEVEFTGSSSRFYTGTFKNNDLNKALEAICKPMGLQYNIDDDREIITIE